ncbi:hypothetical protein [Alkalihalobacillus sp. R86527]|uniref:hypothetical protein n=1 Tax=Alkalihalobacillus sp. R86527 TaxID=3093863 RepID=UPI0036716573
MGKSNDEITLDLELYAEELPENIAYSMAAATVACALCGGSFGSVGTTASSASTSSSFSTAG